jgi:2-polyprenyl-3-methyl-5-hydroxy-6-metoxy-1,4-benzoquinol methylase
MLTFQVAISRDVELPLIQNEHILRAHFILDVGCGNGCFTTVLADKYLDKQFVAIDTNSELISFARQHYSRKNITYVVAGYSDFESADLFDVVVARLVVHIIPDRSDFFRWVHSKLRKHGAFFVIDADDDNFNIYPKPPILCLLDEQTNEKINQVGARDTKEVIKEELLACNFRAERFFTLSPNSIMVDKSIFFRYMVYVMKIEKGENLPIEAYKELFEWYDDSDSFVQYGLYFGLYLKEETTHEN